MANCDLKPREHTLTESERYLLLLCLERASELFENYVIKNLHAKLANSTHIRYEEKNDG